MSTLTALSICLVAGFDVILRLDNVAHYEKMIKLN